MPSGNQRKTCFAGTNHFTSISNISNRLFRSQRKINMHKQILPEAKSETIRGDSEQNKQIGYYDIKRDNTCLIFDFEIGEAFDRSRCL